MCMKVCEVFSAVEYGYWISPKGELHAVGFEEHEDWMMHEIGGYPEEREYDPDPNIPERFWTARNVSPVYQVAYEKGYVRIVTDQSEVIYEGFKEDLQTHLQQFMRLAKETDPDVVHVTVVGRNWKLDGDQFAWPERRGDLIRFIKTGKKVASPYKA